MRGEDNQQQDLFSYGSLEERVPQNHPLRPIRAMVDEALVAPRPRSNATHQSLTDPFARLFKKTRGSESKLC